MVSSRLLPAVGAWALGMMINSVVNVWAQYRADYYWPRDPQTGLVINPTVLPDLGFELLPQYSSDGLGFSLPDTCMLLCMVLAIGRLFFAFKPSRASIIIKRALLLSSASYLGRALCVPVTMLPNPDPMCMPRLVDGSPFWSVMLMPFGLSHTCADVFYSGHSIPITLSIMVWSTYSRTWREKLFGIGFGVFSLLVIICTHFHYTIDVIYGVGVTSIVWLLYHYALTIPAVVLNSHFLMFWEFDAFVRGAAPSAPPVSPDAGRVRLTNESARHSLLADIESGCGVSSEVRLQTLYTGIVPLKFSEDPRLLWGTRMDGGDGSWSTIRGGITGPSQSTFRSHQCISRVGGESNTQTSASSHGSMTAAGLALNAMTAEVTAKSLFSRVGRRGIARLKDRVAKLGGALSREQFIYVMLKGMMMDEDGDALPEQLTEEQELRVVEELLRWYDELDVDGSGSLGWEGIATLVMGKGINKGAIKELTLSRFVPSKSCTDTGLHTSSIMLVKHLEGPKMDKVAYYHQGSTALEIATVDLAPRASLDTETDGEEPCTILYFMYLPDWSNIVISGSDMSLRFYDCRDLTRSSLGGLLNRPKFRLSRKVKVPSAQRCMCWSMSSQTLFTADNDGCIYAWDVEAILGPSSGGTMALRRPKMREANGVDDSGREGPSIITLSVPRANVGDQMSDSDRHRAFLTQAMDATERIAIEALHSSGEEQEYFAKARVPWVTCLMELPAIGLLASCGLNNLIVLWDAYSGCRKRVLMGHTRAVTCMTFSSSNNNPTNVCLLSGGFDYSILVWNPYYSEPLSSIKSHQAPIQAVEVLPDVPGLDDIHRVVSIDSIACIKVHDIGTGQQLQSLPIPDISLLNDFALIQSASSRFNGGGLLVRAVACARQFRVFDLSSAELDHNPDATEGLVACVGDTNPGPVTCARIYTVIVTNQAYNILLTASGNVVRSWSISHNMSMSLASVIKHTSEVSCFCLGDRGLKVFVGDYHGGIAAYNHYTGARLHEYSPHSSPVIDIHYGPSGDHILFSASSDNRIKVHDELSVLKSIPSTESDPEMDEIGRGAEATVLRTAHNLHLQPLTAIAFSLCGELVAFGSIDAVISVRSFEQLAFMGHCIGHRSEITALCFLDPLALLASADLHGNIAIWGLPPSPLELQFKCLYRFMNIRSLAKTIPVSAIDFTLTGVCSSSRVFTASTPCEVWQAEAPMLTVTPRDGRCTRAPYTRSVTGGFDKETLEDLEEDRRFFSTQPPETSRGCGYPLSLTVVTGDEEGCIKCWNCTQFIQSPELLECGLHPPSDSTAYRSRNPHWRGTCDGAEMADLSGRKVSKLGHRMPTLLQGRRLVTMERTWRAHEEAISSVQVVVDPRVVITVGVGEGCKIWSWDGLMIRVINPVENTAPSKSPRRSYAPPLEVSVNSSRGKDRQIEALIKRVKSITEGDPVETKSHRKSILQRVKELKDRRCDTKQ
ncbi:hypothetical protein FOL47_003550 [Perkinsus chesapeaki]|uniref:Sphingomyelin synthase-like domain-containing protein n=1 Tax=Perkinsus chesapeaki TaxID=330153 RepID=A0A7J6MZN9_PERCH|nr:hypothetical protein FOL47_003550 [Perkinsus chesapeaki]